MSRQVAHSFDGFEPRYRFQVTELVTEESLIEEALLREREEEIYRLTQEALVVKDLFSEVGRMVVRNLALSS